MAEQVDAQVLKTCVFETCRFKSGYPYWWKLGYIFHGNKSESKLSHMPRRIRKAVTNFKWRTPIRPPLYIFSFVFVIIYKTSSDSKQYERTAILRGRLGKWRNGRRAGLRNQCLVRVGSSPTLPTEDRGFGIPHIRDPSGTSSQIYLIFAKINLMSYWAFMSSRIQTNS